MSEVKMTQYDENFENDSILLFFPNAHSDPTRGHVKFCHSLIVKTFHKGKSSCSCKQETPEVKKVKDNYLITIYQISVKSLLIEIKLPKPSYPPPHQKQTDH